MSWCDSDGKLWSACVNVVAAWLPVSDAIASAACASVTAACACDWEAIVPVDDATVPVDEATVPVDDAIVPEGAENDGIVTELPVMIVRAVPAELIESVRLACATADDACVCDANVP